MLSFLTLGLAAFISTNLDDFVVLIALWLDPRMRRRDVVTGQLAASLLLLGLGLGIARLAIAIPDKWLGLVGVLPIGVGVFKLIRPDSDDPGEGPRPNLGWLPVLLVTLANGADNVAVYSTLLVSRTLIAAGELAILFGALTLAWCEATRRLARHPKMVPIVERIGAKSVPWILIGIGIYILVTRGVVSG